MKMQPVYSDLFACLYDQSEPIGRLGRGTHYSVFRTAEWLDVVRDPLPVPQIHDFAIIWDEDHDTRVIEAVEAIYMAGLLSPVQFIGERKGTLHVVVAAKFYLNSEPRRNQYLAELNVLAKKLPNGDVWPIELLHFDRSPSSPPTHPHQTEIGGLINDERHKVVTYLRNIDNLWSLGTKTWTPGLHGHTLPPPLIAPPPPLAAH
ncbi:hypothetical protein [Bordetella sp. 15P40C-2]|uniref:hypothetical protein n=1 Tax=Bordetella sp. 15P40C-2 TaxID=2572246 RepID=UPI001920B35E|nr:hypothetical protein [Bordetella sp. 15P40C-2]